MSFGQASGSSMFGSNGTQAKPLFGGASTTQPASTPSLFGSTTTGGLFGASTAAQPAGQTSSSFTLGAPASSQPQTTSSFSLGGAQTSKPGGLFGSSTAPASGTGSSFGGTNTASQPQPTNNLFGGLTGTNQPQQTPSLFGNAAASSTQQTGGGLFGGSTAQQPQTQQTGSLFGGTLGQNNQQTGGLFGAAQNKPANSLFGGSTTQNVQPARPSLFGKTTNGSNQQGSFYGSGSMPGGGLTMGQGNQQPQQTTPGVKIDVSNVRGTTRFNDLHEELQKQIEQIDTFIQQQISFKEQCNALMPAHDQNLSSIPNDVEYVKSKADTVELALDNDSQAINTMKGVVQKDAANARLSFKAIENLKLPQQFHYNGMWHGHSSTMTPSRGGPGSSQGASADEPLDLVSYFSNCATDMTQLLDIYQKNITEIEAHLRTVEASTIAQSQQLMFRRGRDGGVRSSEDQVRELAAVLQEFERGILSVAGKVGSVREDVQEILLKQQDPTPRRGLGRY